MKTLIKNSLIVNEGEVFKGSLLIDGKIISAIFRDNETLTEADKIIEAEGLIMMPGLIDDQVHFREPGNIHKGDIKVNSQEGQGTEFVIRIPKWGLNTSFFYAQI